MIDTRTERMCPLSEATGHVPGTPHPSTLNRWARAGIGGVKLETVKVGGRRYTSIEAIQRFLASLNDADS